MEEVLVKKAFLNDDRELIIVLGKLPVEVQEPEDIKVEIDEKPLKKGLLKLMKKSQYNPRYLQELKSVDELRRQVNFRNHGVF
ncbi:MAG: hypothetical protein ACFE85_13360 [Candidatus Hodarchaeota archaeon]